jgi:hypothetical protein
MSFDFNPITAELDLVGPEPSDPNVLNYEAATTISALKLVKLNSSGLLIYADNSNYQSSQTIGVSMNSGNAGDIIKVKTFGELQDTSFSFSLDDSLFLGSNGSIDNTPPTSGVYLKIGKAIKSDTIFIDIEQAVELA